MKIMRSIFAVMALVVALSVIANRGASVEDTDQIKRGMSRQQAEAILRSPGYDMRIGCTAIPYSFHYACNNGAVIVDYDDDFNVIECSGTPDHDWPKSAWRRLKWQLGYFR